MDEFKPRKNKRHASVDGFIPVTGFHGRKGLGSQNQHFGKKYQKNDRHAAPSSMAPRVDQFGSIDGFTPAVQPKISRPGSSTKPTEVTHSFGRKSDGYRSARLDHDDHFNELEKSTKKRWYNLRKNKNSKMHRKPRFKKGTKIAMVSAAFLVLVGSGLALRAFLLGQNIFKGGGNSVVLNNENVDPTLLRGEGDGRVNILILGKGGSEQRDGPELTDTIILASIDPIAKEATLLSIPRDLWVTAPSGYSSKINEVYANAKYSKLDEYSYQNRNSNQAKDESHESGINAIKQTISENMGVPIHYYTMIDFAGFKKAIDTVGGIDVDVKERVVDYSMAWENAGNPVLAEVGWQKFNGTRALMYARSRKSSPTRGDFARADRQREIIIALKDKVLSTGTLANPLTLNNLISDFGGQVSTDFSVNEILRVYDLAKEISGDKVGSVGLDDYVGGQTINGLSVQVPKAGVGDYSEIQSYVRNIMRDAFLKQEDAKIMILNGTNTPGLATKTSNELKSFGYNVYKIDDAPTSDYTGITLVDLRDGKNRYTQNYLEKRLNVKAVNKLPDDNINSAEADFVIILGTQ